MSLSDCKIIELPKIEDARGNLTFIEGNNHIPFSIKRVFYLYDVPGGAVRGAHAYYNISEFIVSLSGSFDVTLNDGFQKKTFHLNRSYYGLYVCPMIWRHIDNFSSGAVCMISASDFYSVDEYCRDYDLFINKVSEKGK